MKFLKKLLPILILSIFFQSCSDDEEVTPVVVTNTIVDVAVANDLTSLVAAVVRADLATTLSGDGP
ncbi:MAG: transforming growth factor-beta-induced protein, partial [Polaribacter sp.]